ncbi:MAG: hypothetical protein KC503_24940 [Myxococcales bacterium]|nr:hypothetical protein [Myxococcales bacterium]
MTVGVLLVSSAATAHAFEVTLCSRSSAKTRQRARELLQRWIARIDVIAHTSARCRAQRRGASVAWLAQRRGQTYLAVRFADGVVLRRQLPWHVADGAALEGIVARGRIPQLTVMLQGLLVEHVVLARLQQQKARRATRARASAPPHRPLSPHPVRATVTAAPRSTSKPSAAGASRSAVPRASPTPGGPVEEPGLEHAVGRQTARPEARATPPTRSQQRMSAKQPKRTSPARGAEPSPRLQVATQPDPAPGLRDLSIDASVAARWRDAGVWALQASGAVGWRSLFVGVGYQAPATWRFEGRPVEVAAIPLHAGWRPTLWHSKHWRLSALAALSLERLLLRRLDLPLATTRGHWDVGVGAGLRFVAALRGFEVGARAGLTWFPSGQRVEIPDGPSTKFNRLTVLLALCVGYRGSR